MGLRRAFKHLALTAVLASASLAHAQAVKVDITVPEYKPTSGVSGSLNSIGSDTLNNLMTLWQESFRNNYPNVRVQVEGKGSSTAPPALIAGTAQIGPMSREMKNSEIDAFESKFGYKPTKIAVAVDALAVYVNKDNPLQQLTLAQVDAIFSKNRACGHATSIDSWGQVGLADGWGRKPVSLYGRNSASGTYGYFKKVALCKGDYRDQVKEQPGSASVVQGITEDLTGMGYSGIGYKTSGVKTVALAKTADGPYFGTEPDDVLSGKYPLSRFLYLYVNKAPGERLSPLIREFITFVLSKAGQEIVVKDGYLPISGKVVSRELVKLR